MKKILLICLSLVVLTTACASSETAVVSQDFSAEVEVARDETERVDGTDMRIKLVSTSKLIYEDNEEIEVYVELSGIGDDLSTLLQSTSQGLSVDYGGYTIEAKSIGLYSKPPTVEFLVTAAGQ